MWRATGGGSPGKKVREPGGERAGSVILKVATFHDISE